MPTIRRVRGWTRLPEIGLTALAVAALASAGLTLSMDLAGFGALAAAVAGTIAWTFHRWPGEQHGGALHLRIGTQVAALALIAYATGWGAALSLVFVFSIADNVHHSGSLAARPAFDWSLAGIALGQLLIQLGLLPSAIAVPGVHGVAVMGALALAVVAQRIHVLAERKEQAEQVVRASEQRFRALVAHSSDAILVVDQGVRVTYQSSSMTPIFGYDDGSLVGRSLLDIVHPADGESVRAELTELLRRPGGRKLFECRVRHADGRWIIAESNCQNRVSDGDISGLVVNARDVTDRKELEAKLAHRAFHDGLTGLANRHLFRDRVEHTAARGHRRPEPFAVLFLDLDGFKMVNDTLGHAAGDELLIIVAHRLRHATREHDTAARLGGDEFAVLLEDLTDQSDAARVAERILNELRQPLDVGGSQVQIDGSIGIAVSDRAEATESPSATTEELLRNADIAMYMAKGAGKGRYEVFEPSMHVAVVQRLKLESDLQRALQRDEFEVHYQPIVTLEDAEVVGVEALVRWNHPERGMVTPADFIPAAEETGLIIPIGAWVLEEACRRTRQWQDAYPATAPLRVSVNVSPRQITHGDVAADVERALAESGLNPEYLTLEITETALMTDTDRAISLFRELKRLGVRLAVDDFGTGYSSLAYLQSFPFDVLKIDRSFIDGLTRGTQNPAVVRAIIDLGRSLDLQTVAEGIEHAEQLTRFRDLHCNYGQGYLFARPAPHGDIEALLAQRRHGAPLPAATESGARRRA